MTSRRHSTTVGILLLALTAASRAQEGPSTSPLLGGIPSQAPASGVMPLSIADAIERGLAHNLALALREGDVRSAEGDRRKVLGDLLPEVRGAMIESRQRINLAAFGFSLPDRPSLVGPFDVFDARVYARQPLLDLEARARERAKDATLSAERLTLEDTRDLVVLVCGNLYLQSLAAQSRIDAARVQRDAAKALDQLARDREDAGMAAGIDVLRADVELRAREQDLIVADNALARTKLALLRSIGLPLDQEIDLVDAMPFAEAPPIPLDAALSQARSGRRDLKAAQQRLRAAEEERRAVERQRLPRLEVRGDYGAIGPTLATAEATYSVAAEVKIPIFSGGLAGKLTEAEAKVDSARASMEDLGARVSYEVRSALLDLEAAGDRVRFAREGEALAKQQLAQAEDRFRAGVASNLEVVEAEESVASATERRIASFYDHNVAKASLARAMGGAEAAFRSSREAAR